jgi:hypothetical protein
MLIQITTCDDAHFQAHLHAHGAELRNAQRAMLMLQLMVMVMLI